MTVAAGTPLRGVEMWEVGIVEKVLKMCCVEYGIWKLELFVC
jgi:hypothetical protein